MTETPSPLADPGSPEFENVWSTWQMDGGISGYDAATAKLKPEKIVLSRSVNNIVDLGANGITRLQYLPSPVKDTEMEAVARMTWVWQDLWRAREAAWGGKASNQLAMALCIVPVANVVNPTHINIWNAARSSGFVVRSWELSGEINAGQTKNQTLNMEFANTWYYLAPNTKYYAMVIPIQIGANEAITQAKLLYSFPKAPGQQAKGVTFWTNRTPAAPVITSPITNIFLASNSTFNLAFTANDPDKMFGGTGLNYDDLAGVHVQYAPRASAENPNPAWTDLPFADYGTGVLRNRGWYIYGSSYIEGIYEGPMLLTYNGTVPVKVGTNTPVAGAGLLPSGSWQIRMRTFDWGHPYPADPKPLGNSNGNYSPYNYPAVNTSPWSAAVIVTVDAQVPSPIPTWPVGHAAVPEGQPLWFSWQYRNSAIPPFAQGKRTIQARLVGSTTWTTIINAEASASATARVDNLGFSFVSGNAYQWRVQVTDTDNQTSTFSEVATFWMVPGLGSGGVKPIPSETIDGASLGCGTHRVMVYRRGGKERVGELTGITSVEWNRVRDDISLAKVVVQDWGIDCGELLKDLQCWAYELVIFRDNGYGSDRVWEGPITLLTYERDTVTIQAKDVMGYAYRRIIRQKMSYVGHTDPATGLLVGDESVTSRAARVLQNAFAPDDPNILRYLTVLAKVDDAMAWNRVIPAFSRTAFEEVDDMASNAGLDYTAVGRSILLWGTKHRIGTLPEFRDNDLGSTPIVSEYGMSFANYYSVSDGAGIHGEATRLPADGKDTVYGLVEILSSSWASDTAPVDGTYSEDQVQKMIATYASYAERSINDRFPPPVVVRIPDNTTINPDTVISIQQLVPGVVIPLRSEGTLRTVVANQKLDSVKVIETGGTETISITLSPFNHDDASGVGGEEG